MAYSHCIDSAVGPLRLLADDEGLRDVRFAPTAVPSDDTPATPLAEAVR